MTLDLAKYQPLFRKAVRSFWSTRSAQVAKQRKRKATDRGARGAVTGGAQMDAFVDAIAAIAREAGLMESTVFRKRAIELPGFFRPTKQWDMLIVADGKLLAAIELKSQVGPSFGNNFNNRAEEAIGSAVDLWTAFREGAFAQSPRPWVGYLFLLEDCDASQSPVSVGEPHFRVFDEFRNATYGKRYELLCRKLIRERLYTATAFLVSQRDKGLRGEYSELATDLTLRAFTASLVGHITEFLALREGG